MMVNAITDTKKENMDCAYLCSNYPCLIFRQQFDRGNKRVVFCDKNYVCAYLCINIMPITNDNKPKR